MTLSARGCGEIERNGFGDAGVSDANFIIQVKVNQKWSTATQLSSDAVLRKLMPPLQHEYGDVVRALQSEKDTFTGETKWYLYKAEHLKQPCAAHARPDVRPRTQPEEPGPQTWPGIDQMKPEKASRPRKKLQIRKTILAPMGRSISRYLIVPLTNGVNALAGLLQAFVAIPDKMERVRTAALDLSSRTSRLSRDPKVQWLECGLVMSAGLMMAFMATLPGGLTLAVLSGFLVPPVRQYIGQLTPSIASPAKKSIAVFLLIVASGSLELMTPDRRAANVTLDFFMTNRAAIIASAQSSLDTLDYVAVVNQLEAYRSIEDEAVASLLEAAQSKADIELARLKKITSQFLFNGSNRFLTEYIVKSLNDPGSFRHLNTDYWIHDEYLEVQTTYSSFNEVGATVAKTVKAYIDFDGRILNDR